MGKAILTARMKAAFSFALAAAVLVLLYWLEQVLLLIFLAVVLSVLLDAIAYCERRYLKLPSGVSVVLAALIFLIGVGGALALLAVPVFTEGSDLLKTMPEKLSQFADKVDSLEQRVPSLAQFLPHLGRKAAQNAGAGAGAAAAAKTAFLTFSKALEIGADAVATFFLAVFLAWNPERWLRGMALLLPWREFDERIALLRRLGTALRNYLLTYVVYIVAMGSLWALGLWLIGIDYFIVFGVIGGLVELAPYIGPLLALVPPLLVALLTAPGKALYVLLLYVVLHILEGYVLVPILMHEREHLPPPVVILSLLICGTVFGMLGIVLSVPIGTVVYVLLNETVYKRKASG